MFSRVKSRVKDNFLVRLAGKIFQSIVNLCVMIFAKQLFQDVKAQGEEMTFPLMTLNSDHIPDISSSSHKKYSSAVYLGAADILKLMQVDDNENHSDTFHQKQMPDQSKRAFENPPPFSDGPVIRRHLDSDIEDAALEPGMPFSPGTQMVHQETLMNQIEGASGCNMLSLPLRQGPRLFECPHLKQKNGVTGLFPLGEDDLGCEISDEELQPGMPLRGCYSS
jgi:hypothetical protein